MDPIQWLMEEHRAIEKVLTALEIAADHDVPLSFYEKALEFITSFADGTHHAKEEGQLFPLLEEKGIPRHMGPIGVMCEEHEMGRALVKRMGDCVEKQDVPGLRAASLEYAALLRSHIHKEDQVLFPMGRMHLSDLELDNLREHFEAVDQTEGRYLKVADELLAEAGATA